MTGAASCLGLRLSGPCEHMYACLEHEGRINAGHLPEASDQAVHARPPPRGPAHLLPPCFQGLGWIGLLIHLLPLSRLFHSHHGPGQGYLPKTSRCGTFSVRRMWASTSQLSSAKVSHSRCCPPSNLLICAQLSISLSSSRTTCRWP